MADHAAANALALDLQRGDDPLLENRRAIVSLSIFSAAVLGGIALFQVGVVKKLPDPPLPHFDADTVNGSAAAYALLDTPDALLGMTSYAVTACLAGAGSSGRSKTAAWLPCAMAAKTALDAGLAGRLAVKQWTQYRKFSFWSLLVTAATLAALPLALPEAKRAVHSS